MGVVLEEVVEADNVGGLEGPMDLDLGVQLHEFQGTFSRALALVSEAFSMTLTAHLRLSSCETNS